MVVFSSLRQQVLCCLQQGQKASLPYQGLRRKKTGGSLFFSRHDFWCHVLDCLVDHAREYRERFAFWDVMQGRQPLLHTFLRAIVDQGRIKKPLLWLAYPGGTSLSGGSLANHEPLKDEFSFLIPLGRHVGSDKEDLERGSLLGNACLLTCRGGSVHPGGKDRTIRKRGKKGINVIGQAHRVLLLKALGASFRLAMLRCKTILPQWENNRVIFLVGVWMPIGAEQKPGLIWKHDFPLRHASIRAHDSDRAGGWQDQHPGNLPSSATDGKRMVAL